MIEVFISYRENREVGLKKHGDIILAKLEGSPWGNDEKCCVVKWDDPVLEARLASMVTMDNPYPCITRPYAEYETRIIKVGKKEIKQTVMVNRSKIYIDFSAMDLKDVEHFTSGDKNAMPCDYECLATKLREKETKGWTPEPSPVVPDVKDAEPMNANG